MKDSQIKLKIFSIIGFFAVNPIFAYLLFGLILFAVIGFAVQSGCNRRDERRDERRKEQILRNEEQIYALENQRKEANTNVKQTQIESNRAGINFNAVINTDSSKRNSNFSTVRRKYCAEFPGDSKCR